MLRNAERAASILTQLLAYHHKPAGEFIIQAWLERISELMNDEEFERAAKACIFECDRLPTIQDFIALLQGDKKAIEEAKIASAWTVVLEGMAIASTDRPEYVARRQELLDSLEVPFQKALADMGGFIQLGNVEMEKLHWSKQTFEKLCRTYLDGDKANMKSDRYLEAQTNKMISPQERHNGMRINQGLTALSGIEVELGEWSNSFGQEDDNVEF